MTVYFSNPEPLDLQALFTMGLSVKETENPIGEFGTGLKYAIAILLRHQADIRLFINGEEQVFSLESKSFRGEPFDQPHINGQPLPFTLKLGKNWSLWQAYRELASNTRDENGTVTTDQPDFTGTVFAVSLPEFEAIHENNDIFISGKPVETIIGTEVFARSSMNFYLKGVKVLESEDGPFALTYNAHTNSIKLTEDRTASSLHSVCYEVGYTVRHLTNPELIETVLRAEGSFEHKHASAGSCSKAFEDALFENRNNYRLPDAWLQMADDIALRRSPSKYPEWKLGTEEQEMLREAQQILDNLGVPRGLKLIFTPTLGDKVYAVYLPKRREIVLCKLAFASVETLAHSIYEEYVHMDTGYSDETRELQSYLFRKIIWLAKEK